MAKGNKKLHKGSSKKGFELYKPKKRSYQPNADRKAAISEADFRIYLLQRHGLEIKLMRGDGNCLFRSIAHQLKLDPDQHHYHIRSQVVDYMEEKKEFFSMFLEDDESWEDYVSSMRESCTWGGYQELCAASQALNLAVHVFQWNDPKYVIRPQYEMNEDAAPPRVILLSFHDGCHYNSLVPADTSTLTAAGVSADMPLIPSRPVKSSTGSSSSSDLSRITRNILQSMPWIESEEAMLALEWTDSIESDAIELLCSNINGIRFAIAAAARSSSPSSSEQKTRCLSTSSASASATNEDSNIPSALEGAKSSSAYVSSDELKKQSEDHQSAATETVIDKPKRFPNNKKTKAKSASSASSNAGVEESKTSQSVAPVVIPPSSRSRPMSKKEQRQKERQDLESALKCSDPPSAKVDAEAATTASSMNLEDLMREIVI